MLTNDMLMQCVSMWLSSNRVVLVERWDIESQTCVYVDMRSR